MNLKKMLFAAVLCCILGSCVENTIEPRNPKSPSYMDDPPKENTGNTNPPKG